MSHIRTPKHTSKWVEMPKNRQEQYNKIYKQARELAVANLDAIVAELFPDAITCSNYYKMRDMNTGGEGSMWIYRKGQKKGCWVDAGTPATSRSTGDIIHLIAEKNYNGNTWAACEYILWGFGV